MALAWTYSIVDTRQIYDSVKAIYLPIGIGVFVLFTAVIVTSTVRFRGRPVESASRRSEANPIEIAYAVVLTCVAAFLLYITLTAEHKVDTVSATEHPAVTIDVTGARWDWTFHYPRYGITHVSGADGDQPLVVPANRAVQIRLRSADVIHGFWIPQIGFKRDAIPGTTEVVTLDFDQPGRYFGACSEYCGVLHSNMTFPVVVLRAPAFNAWASSRGS